MANMMRTRTTLSFQANCDRACEGVDKHGGQENEDRSMFTNLVCGYPNGFLVSAKPRFETLGGKKGALALERREQLVAYSDRGGDHGHHFVRRFYHGSDHFLGTKSAQNPRPLHPVRTNRLFGVGTSK